MKQRRWDVLIAAVLCAGLGIASGFYAARQSGSPAEPSTTDPTAAADQAPDLGHFSDEALANMGVEYGELLIGNVSIERSIVATVVDGPLTEQPVQAPVSGVVTELRVAIGATIGAGSTAAILVRDPIEPPALRLTQDYAVPSHAEVHAAIRSLRESSAEAQIGRDELDRVARFTGSGEDPPLLPVQRRIDLEYRIRRAEVAAEVAAHELERHGFSEDQLKGLTAGEHVELFDADHTRRALMHGGLWRGNCPRALKALPPSIRALPLAVATVAELAGQGMLSDELCELLENDARAATAFLAIAGSTLRGDSIDDVRRLAALGAFEPTVEVVAPLRAAEWDVARIEVRPGDRVAAGTPLVVLRDPRELRLRIEPVGSELADVKRAIAERFECRAVALVPGSGPDTSVTIDYLSAGGDAHPVAWARVPNLPMQVAEGAAPTDGARFRSWGLQSGLRYRLLVPVEQLTNVYRLPRTAVTEDGPDQIVFLPTGDGGFTEAPVVIVHQDDTHFVVRPSDALQPGVRVVTRGAFELGLAMHAGDVAMDHGHSH